MLKVLIVEDELDLREMYKVQFETTGAQVFGADNIEDGFKIAKKEKPDVALVDLLIKQDEGDKTQAPNGFILLDKLQAGKETKNTKVVIISNLDTPEAKDEAKKKGAVGYIMKAETVPKDVVDKVRGFVGVLGK
ncbi:MAG: response regulator [bacterium]